MKRILIISELFYPKNAIGALRPTKIRKYLTERGYTVDVITKSFAEKDNIENGQIWRIDAAADTLECVSAAPRSSDRGLVKELKRAKRTLISIKRSKLYCRDVLRFIDTHSVQVLEYDAVFTTFGPVSSIFIGLELKKKYPKIKWLCDFRDPMVVEEVSVFFKPYMRAIQNKACQLADKIIAVSRGYLKRICNGRYVDKSYMIPNGYDSEDLSLIRQTYSNGLLRFAYVGSLYEGKRKVSPLFQILRNLIDDGEISAEKICFDYAGNDYYFLAEQAKEYNLEGVLVNHGKLSRDACLQLQAEASFLVLCTWNNKGEEGVFPGKFLEYMLFNKPIIALVDGNIANSEVATVMREGNLGAVYEEKNSESDFEEMKKYFSDTFSEFYTTGQIKFVPSEDVLNRYDYGNIATKIEDLIYG